MIVLDASALVPLLLEDASRAPRIRAWLAAASDSLHAPHLIDLEVLSALRRMVRRGSISEERARFAMRGLRVLVLTRYPHAPLIGRVWAQRANLSVYDAAYVALAEALEARLGTLDQRLARAAGETVDVDLFA